jgi:shikimate kinase
MKVFLIGFMGVGKTTVGRALAERLDVPFIDLDAAIEREAGATITEIFADAGEERLRALEREALLRCEDLPDCVVATGGGTPLDARNRAWMVEEGRVVWIDLPFEVIRRRLAGATDRPLFRDPSSAEALLEARLPAYRVNDLRINAQGRSAVEIAAEIHHRLF